MQTEDYYFAVAYLLDEFNVIRTEVDGIDRTPRIISAYFMGYPIPDEQRESSREPVVKPEPPPVEEPQDGRIRCRT